MKERRGRHRKLRFRTLAAGVAALAVLAAACGGGSGTAQGDADTAEVDRNAEFRWANSFGHSSFDPHRSPNAPGDAAWMRPVYDGLLTLERTSEEVEVAPQLATSYEVAEDGLSIEFELREDVTFQDGTPFDAEAVRANIERATDEESTVSSLLTAVDSVEVVDDSHVVLHLNRPDPGLPYSLAANTIGMMVSPAAFDTDLATTPVGSGPFTLVSASRDAEVVYERWDDHWDPDAALVSRLSIATIPDNNARLNAVRSGELDAAFVASPLDLQARELEQEGYQWLRELAPMSYNVLLNTDMEPFDDVRVRRAVSMAIDREAISEELLGGITPPVYQTFAEGTVGHDPALDESPYDPDAARDLIREAGAEGATVTLLSMNTAPAASLGEVTQQALEDVGLDVEIEPVSPTVAGPTWLEGGHAAHINVNYAEPEPSLTLERAYLGGINLGEPPAELVDMAEAASRLPAGSDEQEAAYQEISAYLDENPIHVPLVSFSTVVLARPEVVDADQMVKLVVGKLDFRGVGVAGS